MSSIVVAGDTSGSITISAPAVSGSNTLSLPAVTDTLAGIAATQTLTNKTLTSPVLTTPALGTPASGVLTNCTGVPASALPAGSVLQVVQSTLTAATSAATITFTDSGLTATITPRSATSKILVIFQTVGSGLANNGIGFAIVRNSTTVWTSAFDAGPRYYSCYFAANWNCTTTINYLDTPSSGSAITYKIQYAGYNASTIYFNLSNGTATMQLLEIAG